MLVCEGHYTKIPQRVAARTDVYFLSQFQSLEVQDQGVGRFDFLGGLSLACLSSVSTHSWCLYVSLNFLSLKGLPSEPDGGRAHPRGLIVT